jgi:hypothetical protein
MTSKSPTKTNETPASHLPAEQAANTDEVVSADETLIEQFMKLVSCNPQFREAVPSGKALAIVGARPPPLR